jgi:hypothetical protein
MLKYADSCRYYCWHPVRKISTWQCPKNTWATGWPEPEPTTTSTPRPNPTTTTPAPPAIDIDEDDNAGLSEALEHCQLAPAPWEAWWDDEEEMCYCYNPVTQESTWECPEPAHPPAAIALSNASTTPAPPAIDIDEVDPTVAPTTIPAPAHVEPASQCPDVPAPWEAFWDDEEEMCYCYNAMTQESSWKCPEPAASPAPRPVPPSSQPVPSTASPRTTPAPSPVEPASKCPTVPAPWEAWFDDEEEMCYCWNAVTKVSTWDCPKLPAARPTTTPRPGTQFTRFTNTKYKNCCATCGKLLRQLRRSKHYEARCLVYLLYWYNSTSAGYCCASYACASLSTALRDQVLSLKQQQQQVYIFVCMYICVHVYTLE